MIKKILLSIIFLSFFSYWSFSQNDTILIYYNGNWEPTVPQLAAYYTIAFPEKESWRRLDFYADNDKLQMDGYYEEKKLETKTGPFKYYRKNGQLSSKGYYRKNKKVGMWYGWSENNRMTDSSFYNDDGVIAKTSIRWYDSGEVSDSIICDENGNGINKRFWIDGSLAESGALLNGKRSGKWIFNGQNGIICQEVFYEADSALRYTCYDEKGKVQTKDCIYEREAEYKGGHNKWLNYLSNAMTRFLPQDFFKGELEGYVVIQFVIDKEGKVTDVKIVSSTVPGLNEAAIKIISSSPKWIPAIQYNRPVKAYRKQPLTFKRAE